MRNLISAAIAAALLTGCPQEKAESQTSANDGGVADRDVTAARAPAAQTPATAASRMPSAVRGGVVKAIAFGPSDAVALSAAAAATPLAVGRAQNDANADGRSDVTWLRTRVSDTDTAHWRMNGTGILQSTGPTRVWAGNTVVAQGDFDGDQRVDQLWFNSSDASRQLTLARQNESGGFDQSYVATIGAGWVVNETVDLNGDGKSDIVWVDRARGLMAYWLMSGPSVLGSRLYSYDAANFNFFGSGDFDGDGRGDLLWMGKRTDGPLFIWRSRTDGHFDQQRVGDLSISFQFQGTTDLNGDGRSDLVFTSFVQRLFAYWLMNGPTVQQTGVMGVDIDKYEVAGLGDYDGDGKGDVLWTGRSGSSSEALYLWRSLGNGAFDPRFVAYYDHSTWRPFPIPTR
ncbi:VCBS repeat-containing protein [Lysobacter sp. 5GHs7-4]|uniref:FG-GAP repeat domain-containing protein n=1 Tax=Lysobacter sp. 5GHs7-4 TaxID=2904253 RepID=UPI001E3CC158|nr:VCBS repeat-containing protein [Lysobacter sp. 5GHs7-4]UHQ22678.1 VCBS repeat-containing protein [Lysobacter sp. 5GHs7-4]